MLELPLFPLGLVLFPGLLLPLHVFEERYRTLVGELLERPPAERRFGVIAIRTGREVGAGGVSALYDVGCVAQLRRVEPHSDGRFDIVTTGAERFRLLGRRDTRPYPVGEVELLAEQPGSGEVVLLDPAVRSAYQGYLTAMAEVNGEPPHPVDLPDGPSALSYLVAATVVVDLDVRQALLSQPDDAARLAAELILLRRETHMLRVLTAAPAVDLTRGPVSPN